MRQRIGEIRGHVNCQVILNLDGMYESRNNNFYIQFNYSDNLNEKYDKVK